MNVRQLIQSVRSIIHAQWRGNMKVERILIAVLALALMLTLGVRLGQAQVQGPVLLSPPQPNSPAANLQDQIPIQGRLTDASGTPLNGTYSVTLGVYSAPAGGVLICGNLATDVTVTNGLFNSTLDLCDAANVFEGDQMYLGVKVGSDPEMTPRQPILGVPYAYNLKKGAVIKGADSYVFVPGSAFVKNNDTDTTRWDIQVNGAARVWRGATAGAKYIFIPITLPGMLYGQAVTVKSITVYYRVENGATNYITGTSLTKQTSADSYVSILGDATNHTSTTAASYTVNPPGGGVTLSSSAGILGLYLTLAFANDTEYIQIGGVRLELGHQ